MRPLVAALFVAAVSLVAIAPAAQAADSIIIRKVDFLEYPKVTISALVSGPRPALDSFTIRENGKIVVGPQVIPIGETDTPVGIALVIDISGSMNENSKLVAAKEAAKQFVANRFENDEIAIVTFNQTAQVAAGFTKDEASLNQAIDNLVAGGETAMFDGVRTSATLLGDRQELQANIVLLSDGADTASQNSLDEVKSAILGSNASLFAVGLLGGEFDEASLKELAATSGGRYVATPDPASLKALYDTVQRDIQNQYEISYTSTASGSVEISVATSGLQAIAGPLNAGPGSVSEGIAATPEVVGTSRFAEPLGSSSSLVVIAGIAFLAAAFLVVSIAALSRRGLPTLSKRLQPYGPEDGAAFVGKDGGSEIELAQTALVQRAVDVTARLARGGNVLETLEKKLEQADLPVRPAEALFFYLVGVLTFVVVGGLLGGLFLALLALIFIGLTPIAVLNFLGARRRARFTSQLPDVLRMLASSLRAGFSLLQAADAAADQVDDPMAKELKRVLVEARLGRPLELALDDSARRSQSPDYNWVVMAIGIQREVGGNLAELLTTVADTMVARERLRQEVKTLTAEGRISAIVLAALPVAIGIAIYILNPDYLDPLINRTSGQIAMLVAILAAIGGFAWMRKIVDISV